MKKIAQIHVMYGIFIPIQFTTKKYSIHVGVHIPTRPMDLMGHNFMHVFFVRVGKLGLGPANGCPLISKA